MLKTALDLWASDEDELPQAIPSASELGRATIIQPHKTVSHSIFDDFDSDELETALQKHPVSAKESHLNTLYDEVEASSAILKPTTQNKPPLYDDGESSASEPSTNKDYKCKYETEKKRRIALETIVANLRVQLHALGIECDADISDRADESGHDNRNRAQQIIPSTEWDKLALEERQRRLHHRVAVKRSNKTGGGARRPNVSTNTAAVSRHLAEKCIVPTNAIVAPTEDEIIPEDVQTKEVDYRSVKDAEDNWSKLAAQEKAERRARGGNRKRPVKPRVGDVIPRTLAAVKKLPSLSSSSASSVVAKTLASTTVPSIPGHIPTAAIDALQVATHTSAVPAIKSHRFDSDSSTGDNDSGWSSSESDLNSESDASTRHASASVENSLSTKHQSPRDSAQFTKQAERRRSHTSCGGTGIETLAFSRPMTEAEAMAVEKQFILWARGKSFVQLLLSVGEIYDGDLPITSLEMCDDEYGDVSAIRKAYLTIMRVIHPDKHSHLDRHSQQFAQCVKASTILSDAYNRFKVKRGL